MFEADFKRKMSIDSDAADELILYLDNEYDLYRQKKEIMTNLTKKFQKGTYLHTKAPTIWMYLVESAAKKYCKEFCDKDINQKWFELFTVSSRKLAAKELANRWYKLAQAGRFDEG
jgi:hypothetical protein